MRALLAGAITFLGTVVAASALLQILLILAPGDPIDLLPNGEELRPLLEQEWRLDRPPVERVLGAVWDAARGDLGVSLSVRPGTPVLELALRSGQQSLSRLVLALAVSLGLGVLLAAWGPARRLGPLSRALGALPVFLFAWGAVTLLNAAAWEAMEAGWIARPSWFALPDQASLLRETVAVLALGIGSGALAEVQGAAHDELRRIDADGYVDAARALGLRAWPHILLNLAPPLLSVAASRVTFLVGGLLVVEKVLLTGGAGSLLWDAALGRDYPLALGLGLLAATTVAGARFLAEALRLLIDPRLREGRA